MLCFVMASVELSMRAAPFLVSEGAAELFTAACRRSNVQR